MTANKQTCPKCNSPVTPGMKFCESCGARIEAPPACPACGVPLTPNAKFCEGCGATIGPAAAPVPVPPAHPAKAEEKKAAEPIKPEPSPSQKTSAPVPAAPPVEPAKTAGQKPASSRTMMIVGGIIILALLGAAVYFVGLPMLSGSAPSAGVSPAPAQEIPASGGSGSAATSSSGQASMPSAGATVSFTAGPTQQIPAPLLVQFSAARDPITGLVTITFDGGAGRYGVKNVDIRLSRSDGQVIAKTVTLTDIGDGLTLQGTKTGDDRIELTVNYSNGDHYKVIDQILEYKRRNW